MIKILYILSAMLIAMSCGTSRGVFGFCVITGYCLGLISKFISGDITYVVAFYILDVVMVAIDVVLTIRNHRLDKLADAAKARCDCR